MNNPAVEGMICKGILTLADFHRIISEIKTLAYQKWSNDENKKDSDYYWSEAEKEYFRFHFMGDNEGKARQTFGLNHKVADWK